ncbi:MAG: diacylglycerol kinase [Actinobacteria bacterium HGW-Actinobacteria-7]|nr:MAG: diacylglycerol kinase [Actinobacteria bacterium HGW-Actinobacteria-7]
MKRGHSLLWSFNFAIDGIVYALRTQRNMRLHMGAAVLVAVASLFLDVTGIELAAVVFAISLVFITELVNTALEAGVDVAIDHYDPLAKIAKDVAAGAVLVAAINAVVVAYLVLFERVRLLMQDGLDIIKIAPSDLTIISLCIVLLAVLVMKAVSQEGTWLQGGWPSGHAAVAFGSAAILGFITGSAGALVLGLFIAFLVAQSRVEAEIHSVPQVIVGALMGLLIVTAVFQVFFR